MNTKLSPHTSWLFAFGSIAAGIAASYALNGLGQKVTAAVYFAIVAAGGFGATYWTRARVRGAVLSFFTGAGVAAVAYYMLVASLLSTATTAVGGTAQVGSELGKTMGIFVAALVFLETIVAGIGGAIAGAKVRAAGGLSTYKVKTAAGSS